MLKIKRSFIGTTVTDSFHGDSNQFLQSLLIEVVTENYRQLMSESILVSSEGDKALNPDPPLRANEMIMSSLFANALSKTAARSRSEARVDRGESDLSDDNEDSAVTSKTGRVDFLAWYGRRTYAIELKMATMNCSTAQLNKTVQDRWDRVVIQTSDAQTFLRERNKEDRIRYPSPVSLALMVVVGRRAISSESAKTLDEDISNLEDEFFKELAKLDKPPSFQAIYTFPKEFRQFVPRRNGRPATNLKNIIYTPFVAFLARPAVNSTKAAGNEE